MLQARGLSAAAVAAQSLGLSVMVFTGYHVEELEGLRLPGVPELLAATDVLVDGPFVAGMPEAKRNWVGSSNQRFHYLTNRYDSSIETNPAFGCGIEVRVQPDATMKLNGWPVDMTRRKTVDLSKE
jgi:anaerobic ribonucleoside-triphosphate reductase activating protein